jgi:hypothetical protein
MVVKSCAAMCVVNMRSFAVVSGEGFQSLLQTVLDIGVASKNPIRIKDLLSNEVTVKRAAVKTYQTIRHRRTSGALLGQDGRRVHSRYLD